MNGLKMNTSSGQPLYNFIQKLYLRKVHHVIFWLIYFTFWVNFYSSYYKDISQLYQVTGVYLLSHASIYYFSYYYLIPKFLKKYNAILFVILFLSFCLIMGNLMYLFINAIFNQRLEEFFQSNYYQAVFFFTFSNIFTGGMLLAIKSFFDHRKIIKQHETMEKVRLESELQYLKAQVNPHFLFNAINSVYVLIRIDPEKASETLIKLSNLLRSQLYEFTTDKISIEQELDYLENYIELEKIRRGDRVSIKTEFDGELEGFDIAPLLLIPFLENCFKHLSTFTDRENKISIRITREIDTLKAYFYNTCESYPTDKSLGGIGLQNTKRRLELLYPKNHILEAHGNPESFEVNLEIKFG